jgi:hypothetical protein
MSGRGPEAADKAPTVPTDSSHQLPMLPERRQGRPATTSDLDGCATESARGRRVLTRGRRTLSATQ